MYHPSDPSPAALAGQVAIVTGGGRGVGLGIVQSLAQAGMSVAIVGRTEAEIEQAAEAARHSGVSALTISTISLRMRTRSCNGICAPCD